MEWFVKQEEAFDKYRFGAMTLMITIQSCIGGVAAYMAILHDLWSLVGIAAFLSMGSNAMFIAQAKANICIIGFYASVIINTIFIIIGLVMM